MNKTKLQEETIMEIQNTQTAENLHKALAGESIARNKYTYFAQEIGRAHV